MKALACLILVALPTAAQDAWAQRVAGHRARQRPGAEVFLLLVPRAPAFRGTWDTDGDLAGLLASGDLQAGGFGAGQAEALATSRGWGPEPHWVLLSPTGDLLASGDRAPEAAALLDAIRTTGWRPRTERRARFLMEHPDQGDARMEALMEALDVAIAPLFRRAEGSGEAAGSPGAKAQSEVDRTAWARVAEALQALRDVPGWTGHPQVAEAAFRLGWGRSVVAELLEGPLAATRQDLEAALAQRPGSQELWRAWGLVAAGDPGARPEELLSRLEPGPGQARYPAAAAGPLRMVAAQREDWAALEQLTARALEGAWPTGAGWPSGELKERQTLLAAWVPARAAALTALGRVREVGELLERSRSLVGGSWGRLLRNLRPVLLVPGPAQEGMESMRGLFRQKDLPDPPTLPDPLPPRLALIGVPAWKAAWVRLGRHETFDAFLPGELAWIDLSPDAEATLRRSRGWDATPRWVLLRGEEVAASGTELPDAGALGALVRGERLPLLERLNAFVAAHPDHLEAREALVEALRGRMPHLRMEVQLLDQARRTLTPFHPGEGIPLTGVDDWTPLPELWTSAARRTLPLVEEGLRRWPEALDRWQAWLDWASLHPAKPDPGALLDTLALWRTRANGGSGPVPDAVAVAVARHLKAAGRWEALAGWCRRLWDGGLWAQAETALGAAAGRLPQGRAAHEVGRLMSDLAPLYLEALARLGKEGERKQLLETLSRLPELGAKLSAPPSTGRAK